MYKSTHIYIVYTSTLIALSSKRHRTQLKLKFQNIPSIKSWIFVMACRVVIFFWRIHFIIKIGSYKGIGCMIFLIIEYCSIQIPNVFFISPKSYFNVYYTVISLSVLKLVWANSGVQNHNMSSRLVLLYIILYSDSLYPMTFTRFLFKYVDLCFAVQEGPCVKRVRHVTSSSRIWIQSLEPTVLRYSMETTKPYPPISPESSKRKINN